MPSNTKDEPQSRPLYIYNLPPEVLNTLTVKDVVSDSTVATDSQPQTETNEEEAPRTAHAPNFVPGSQLGLSCALCSQAFDTVEDKRSHVKSDMHLFNLKQKIRGLPPVSEDDFEKLAENLDESLSGSADSDSWSESESDDDDEAGGGSGNGGGSSGNMLASLLKKQAVLAKSKSSQAESDDAVTGGGSSSSSKKTGKNSKSAKSASSANSPFVWFSSPALPKPNTYFGMYKAMFTNDELAAVTGGGSETQDKPVTTNNNSLVDALKTRQLRPQTPAAVKAAGATGRHIFMCMLGGGHFAAMVVALAPYAAGAKGSHAVPMNREATVLARRTFHRYTTRRKQGGSQSANDSAKGAAHSAGSTLRRYNEQALVEDVRGLLHEWKELIDTSDLVFVRATGTANQRTIFGPYDNQVLRSRDPRIRGIPFPTRRPTHNETMRCFIELTRLKVREIEPAEVVVDVAEQEQKTIFSKPQKKLQKLSEADETALLHTTQLQALARRVKVPAVLAYLERNGLSAGSFRFFPAESALHHRTPTLLHLAASQNAAALVAGLLQRTDADPAVANGDGKTAFELAGDRATRDAFRVARGELEREIDWEAARVPAAISRAEVEKREARDKEEEARREAERRRTEEAKLKEAAAIKPTPPASSRKKTVGVPKTAQDVREQETRGLTPEQRQRLERERRARAAEERIRRMQQGS